MKRNVMRIGLAGTLLLCLFCCLPLTAAAQADRAAVVLAVFGTSHPSALDGILNIRKQVAQALPGTRVEIAFTSNMIRRIWQKRRNDPDFLRRHPEIPGEILSVKGPLAAISCLQDEGFGTIIVQPTLMASGEEYADLASYVAGLNAIRTIKAKNMPFRVVALGRPVLGTFGIEHPYRHDIERLAASLADDASAAVAAGAALVYMGHGNEYYSTGAYLEFAEVMRLAYPEVQTHVVMVEGFPAAPALLRDLEREGARRVLLRPFMTVAGEHAKKDMAGEESDSLRSILAARGIEVMADLRGLGENDRFAALFVSFIRETALDHGIVLEQ